MLARDSEPTLPAPPAQRPSCSAPRSYVLALSESGAVEVAPLAAAVAAATRGHGEEAGAGRGGGAEGGRGFLGMRGEDVEGGHVATALATDPAGLFVVTVRVRPRKALKRLPSLPSSRPEGARRDGLERLRQ